MNKDTMYDRLYNDYLAIRLEWEQALDDLSIELNDLKDARRQKAEAKEALELYQHTVVMGETHKEGRVNGSNEAKRKRQTTLLLADLQKQDLDYKSFITTAEKAELRVVELECSIEMLRNKISFLRNQSKMVAGLAGALAG